MAQVVTLTHTNCLMLQEHMKGGRCQHPVGCRLNTGFLCQVETVSEVHRYMPQLGGDKVTEGQCKNSTAFFYERCLAMCQAHTGL